MVEHRSSDIEKASANPTLGEAIRRGWDWVVFAVRVLSRVGGPKAWYRAFRRITSLLMARSQQSAASTSVGTGSSVIFFGQKHFYEATDFPFAGVLEDHWQVIQHELQQLQHNHFIPWSERYLYKDGWTTFGLYAFGIKIEKNCQLCPQTTKLIETIPNLVTAGFSSLAPHTHIAPHAGYPEGVLRCHLGLIVPDDCGIRVGDEVRHWQEGNCLIFDDTFEHEAWNRSDRTRIVLLLDFKPPHS
ncbi:MAG: aspartyl/asparaginyl beta-hydroxylase domain-containing protein [Leptolyngbyaceae cyanobacterium bins.302]|nr:aspartyl/asparaginyl beta-hydroxylase domain-containing protein [Leptolyngbyaceae cyanobacterium bins.302]